MTGRIERTAWFPSGIAAQLLLALVGGAVGVPAFAPFYFWPMALVSIGVLFALWQRSTTGRRAFSLGFAWGLGLLPAACRGYM